MSRRDRVSFDRRIDLEWLDYVAGLTADGHAPIDVRQKLISFLGDKLSGPNRSDSACGKAVRLLSRIWVNVDQEVIGLRDQALEVLPNASPDQRLAMHWTLCLGGFPFFGDVATHGGRLLSLQGTLSTAQVLRRLYEQWGERSTLCFTVQRALRSMVQWGALADTVGRGIYTEGPRRIAVHGVLAQLLLEALLIYEGKALPVDQTMCHPAFFPFDVILFAHELRQSPRFEVHRQGLDVDMVQLAQGSQ